MYRLSVLLPRNVGKKMWVWPTMDKEAFHVRQCARASVYHGIETTPAIHRKSTSIFRGGHLVTCRAHTTIWQNLLLQTTNANQGESWPGKFQQRLKVIQGLAVDDIRSFVMPDDASTLALQQGPYWTHKRSKIYRR